MTVVLESSLEAQLRRYVLGQVDDTERLAIEERLVFDHEAFEFLGSIEEGLSEEYLDGALAADDRRDFERSVLSSEPGRERVGLIRLLGQQTTSRVAEGQASLPSRPLAERLRTWIRAQPAYGWALAATAIVLIGLCLAQLSERQRLQRGLNEALAQVAATSRQNDELRAEVDELQTTAHLLGSSLEEAKQPAVSTASAPTMAPPLASSTPPVVATFVLGSGLLRGDGRLTRVAVPAGAQLVRLTLPLEADDYPSYRATLLDADAEDIYAIVGRGASVDEGNAVTVSIPASVLLPGDYQMTVSGLTPDGSTESVASYPFRVMAE